jgi:hypothetical protein
MRLQSKQLFGGAPPVALQNGFGSPGREVADTRMVPSESSSIKRLLMPASQVPLPDGPSEGNVVDAVAAKP